MRISSKSIFRTAIIASAMVHLGVLIACADTPSVEEIVSAWKSRTQQIESASIDWTEESEILPGSQVGRNQREQDDDFRPFPAEPKRVTIKNRLRIKGNRWSWNAEGDLWSPELEAFATTRQTWAFNGTSILHLIDYLVPVDLSRAHDIGFIHQYRGKLTVAMFPQVTPLTNWLNPLQTGHGHFDEQDWLPTSVVPRQDEGGTELYELVFRHRQGVVPDRSVLVKGSPGYPAVLYSPATRLRISTEYGFDEEWGSIPKSWSYIRLLPDKVTLGDSTTAEVTKLEINQPVEDHEFDFAIPIDALVSDFRDKEKPVMYIIKSNGGKRVITHEELQRGATYQQLIKSQVGYAPGTRTLYESIFWTFLGLANLLVAAPLFLWASRARHAP
jgi:hypothetical protein